MSNVQWYRARTQGSVLSLMLCCHHLAILRFLVKNSYFHLQWALQMMQPVLTKELTNSEAVGL